GCRGRRRAVHRRREVGALRPALPNPAAWRSPSALEPSPPDLPAPTLVRWSDRQPVLRPSLSTFPCPSCRAPRSPDSRGSPRRRTPTMRKRSAAWTARLSRAIARCLRPSPPQRGTRRRHKTPASRPRRDQRGASPGRGRSPRAPRPRRNAGGPACSTIYCARVEDRHPPCSPGPVGGFDSLGRAVADSPAPDVLVDGSLMLGAGRREVVGAVVARDEEQGPALAGVQDRLHRRPSRVGDRPGREPLVRVGVVGVVGIPQVDPPNPPLEALTGLALFDRHRTSVDDRRVGLEPLGLEAVEAEAIQKDARDVGSLLFDARLFFDDRGQGQDLALLPAKLGLERFGGLVVLPTNLLDDLLVSLYQAFEDLRRFGLAAELIGVGEQVALDRVALDAQGAQLLEIPHRRDQAVVVAESLVGEDL